jgi:hypothetical protein
MTDYNAYGELYDQRPELIIHDRLKYCGSVTELVDLAKQNNFKVNFERGPLRHDLLIKWNDSPSTRPESYSLTSGLRYLRRISGGYRSDS